MDNMDLSDQMVVAQLIEGQPPRWEGGFDGLQDMVYKGLKSSESFSRTLDVLHRLSGFANNELIGDGNRLLFNILANLAHFLHQFEPGINDPKTLARATMLARVAESENCPRLAASLLGFANGQYKAEGDFLGHIISEIRSYYFPRQDVNSLIFLMGLLTNTTDWFRVKIMQILCVLLPEVDMRRGDITCHGPDLISPLLRLLQTDLCPRALQVMDHIMTVSGNPMERHHLRMSMASSASSRAIRKEYERIQSLYGIPEPTGWSIPMPATQSSLTRHNVHAVFYTCAEVDRMELQETAPTEVEFHADGYTDSFFPMRADTMKSFDTQMDGNMGDIVQKLDSLDDFFEETETTDSTLNPGSVSVADPMIPGFSGSFADSSENRYDQQTAPLLRKSLARTASTSSFHNGLAESRPANVRMDTTIPITVNTAVPLHSQPPSGSSTVSSGLQQPRPVSHTRSVTSPVNNLSLPPGPTSNPSSQLNNNQLHIPPAVSATPPIGFNMNESAFLSDDESEETLAGPSPGGASAVSAGAGGLGAGLSDLEERPTITKAATAHTLVQPRSATDGSSHSLESMIRSGMRRLTGGAATNREKEKQRELVRAQQRALAGTIGSPRVPKVPTEYLGSNPASPGQ